MDKKKQKQIEALYSEMGRRGAKARAQKLSAARRSEIAKKAALKRWAAARKKGR